MILALSLGVPLPCAGSQQACDELEKLGHRYLALSSGHPEDALDRHEARLEILAALGTLKTEDLGQEDWIDFQLLVSQIRSDVYWLMGADTVGRLPLPGFLYRRIFDEDLTGPPLMQAIYRDLKALPGLLDRRRRSLGKRPTDRKRRLDMLMQVLQKRLPLVIAHAGRWKNGISRAAAQALKKVQQVQRLEKKERATSRDAFSTGVGPVRFKFLLNRVHLISLDPDSIQQLGRQMVARTEAQLDRLAQEIDPGRPWRRIVEDMADDHPALGDLPRFCQAELERAIHFVEVNDLVSLPPGAKRIRVKPWSAIMTYPYGAYLKASCTDGMAHYAVPDLTVEGLDPEERRERQRDNNIYWTRIVAVHEGIPGHHLQFVHANRHPSPIRRAYYSHVFGEGWALYCEELMYRHGYYPDLMTRMAQLRMRLWRSLRMVIDVGLHCRNMDAETAVDLLVNRIGLARACARSEVRRYLGNPTRPSSYILGYIMIMELRESMEAMLGCAFDEKAFHDELLSMGAIPLPMIRDVMLRGKQ